jgi:hypothetical protein
MFVSYGGPFTFAACLKLLQDCLLFLQPQLLRLFLSFISAYQSARLRSLSDQLAPSPFEGLSIAALMFAAAVVQSIIVHQVSVILGAHAAVDTCCSTSSVASRLACAFVRALSQSFIRRPSCYPMTNAGRQQGTLSTSCRLTPRGCKTCAHTGLWPFRPHSR